jgi:hypothetical protein
MADNDSVELEIELIESEYRVTLHQIEFQRDLDHKVQRMVYQFRLHVGTAGQPFP